LLSQVAGFGLVVVAIFAVVVLLFLIGSPLDKWKAENPLYAGAQPAPHLEAGTGEGGSGSPSPEHKHR